MEILDKENAVAEARVAELQASLSNLMAQEEQLRLQQASIREHLNAGCKPELSLEPESHAPPSEVMNA